MPGPAPKPAATRRRRNPTTGSQTLLPTGCGGKPPPLGEKKPAWRKGTRDWWKIVWASPMATAYLEADMPVLRRLAALIDEYARSPEAKLLAEIRQLEDRFGLSPMARRKLEWEIAPTPADRELPTAPKRRPGKAGDPRGILRAVK